ncbi:MAG: hypothetical protein QM733_00975 [Ilumatobacteraceae bacterium]
MTELAVVDLGDETGLGAISKKVLSDSESLIHGNELLADVGVVGTSARDRTGYTLAAVQAALDGIAPPADGREFSAWDWFVDYLVLDAPIGNTDCHQEDWAVIADGGRRLAPTSDHASCLGFLLDDAERDGRLATRDRDRTVQAYAARARSKFDGSTHPCDIAHQGLSMVDAHVRDHRLERAAMIRTVEPILGRVPARRMSPAARRFAAGVFAANRARTLPGPSVR